MKMIYECKVSNMQKTDIHKVIKIWLNRYKKYSGDNNDFPAYWGSKTNEFESFLNNKIENSSAIVAKLNNEIVGFLAYDEFPSGLIDEIGAYIKLEYRGKKVGKQLLKSISKYCSLNNISCIHIDFETANLYANRFWLKYFNSMLVSMRRTINKNINTNINDM